MLNEIRSAKGVIFMPHSLFLPAEEPLPAALSVQFSAASGRHGVKANHIKKEALKNQGFFAAPDRIRTCGLSVRSRTLYPLSYGCVRAVFQPVFLFYMESWKMSIPFPLFPFVKSSFIIKQSLPKAAARFHRHTDEWYGQKKICRSLPY